MIWGGDYTNLPPAPSRDVRIMFLVAAIFGAALVIAALIAPWLLKGVTL